jgi:hypothetical protein
MAATQLTFNLRTSGGAKTVHLLGSWDNYQGQLPLSKDSAKKGAWKGTFRFQSSTLTQGQRYWYYYIIDGYQVSHDPAQAFTTEPTTGRALNILDVPLSVDTTSARASRSSREIPRGRPLSLSKIQHPSPVKPNQTRHLTEADYEGEGDEVDALTSRFSSTTISEEDYYRQYSPASSVGSSLSSRSGSSSPSSASSLSDYSVPSSVCTCERYGITRAGDRVKLDCGGSRCSSDSDSCCSDSDQEPVSATSSRRQGVVVRR